jgi:membrane-bound lytic murein transglycosylase B
MKKHEEVKPPEKKGSVPAEYIPIYKAAAKKYDIPWYLLAAHHRVETRFSKMTTMTSPVGAEGPMQFMPCTFVGWKYPSCEGLGKGSIPKADLEDPSVIKKYGGYGVDANGDGKADPWNLEDAVFSAAKFLSKNGASKGNLTQAVYTYNHSERYVKDVLYYADLYKKLY